MPTIIFKNNHFKVSLEHNLLFEIETFKKHSIGDEEKVEMKTHCTLGNKVTFENITSSFYYNKNSTLRNATIFGKNTYGKTEKVENSFYIRHYEKLIQMRNTYATLAREQRYENSALENRQKKKIIYYCKSKNLMAY